MYYTIMTVSSAVVDFEFLDRIGFALADPIRRRILVELLDGPAYPSDLATALGTTRANLSNHLTCLRESCRCVVATAEGRRVRYELADQRLGEALRLCCSVDAPGRFEGEEVTLVCVCPNCACDQCCADCPDC